MFRMMVLSLLTTQLIVTGAQAQSKAPGAAQDYPTKPIRLIVPFAAG